MEWYQWGGGVGLIAMLALAFLLLITPLLIAHALYRQASAQLKLATAMTQIAKRLNEATAAHEDLAYALKGKGGRNSAAESLEVIAEAVRTTPPGAAAEPKGPSPMRGA